MSEDILLEDINPDALLANGFEDAYMGYVEGWFDQSQSYVAVYDRDKCIEILINRDGMDEDEAEEFFQFNVAGAYVGKFTPVFFTKFPQ